MWNVNKFYTTIVIKLRIFFYLNNKIKKKIFLFYFLNVFFLLFI